jgi:Uma2 family endonuclease
MQAAFKRELVSVDDYLAGEEGSEVKHEYLGGVVYAMAGTSKEHNRIAQNIAFAARPSLKGKPCEVFISDVKVRLKALGDDVFYYPDVMVACDPRDTHRLFSRYPKLLVEVSSPSTQRLDRREKRWSYQTIETLEEYVIAAQDRIEVTVFRRVNNWKPEVFNRLENTVKLKSIGLALKVSSIYEGVMTSPCPARTPRAEA